MNIWIFIWLPRNHWLLQKSNNICMTLNYKFNGFSGNCYMLVRCCTQIDINLCVHDTAVLKIWNVCTISFLMAINWIKFIFLLSCLYACSVKCKLFVLFWGNCSILHNTIIVDVKSQFIHSVLNLSLYFFCFCLLLLSIILTLNLSLWIKW